MDDTTLATFRINVDDWKSFQAIAKAEKTNASRLLTEFVQWYKQGNRLPKPDASAPTINLDTIEELINSRVQTILESQSQLQTPQNIDEILERISSLETSLESRIENLERSQIQSSPIEEGLAALGKLN